MRRVIDLHVHTTASDGTYTPGGMVRLAKACGLVAVAITDHDTTDGIDEAVHAARDAEIELVPGVEISVGDTDNIHILGLYIDHHDKNMRTVIDFLKDSRKERNMKMIKLLRREGFDITYDEVLQFYGASNMGRLHIAQYIQKKGLVNDYRKVFKQYIINGGKAYVSSEKLSERDGIEAILKSGGIPILAHINYLKKSDHEIDKTVKRLKDYGLMGLEVYYSGYNARIQKLAFTLAGKYGLLKSGGTDFHGAHRRGVYIGKGRGNMSVPYSFLEEIKRAAGIAP